MTFWELRVFVVKCDAVGCTAEVRVECSHHVLGSLPEGWTRLPFSDQIRCPAHSEGVSEEPN